MVEQIENNNVNQNFSNLINPYTNKPVQTGKSVTFNQNTYDGINYMQAKNNVLDELNAEIRKPQSINQQALYNIPVVPDFMKDEYNEAYNAGNWLNSLNIATPDEIDEWRAMGKMGIAETAQRLKSLKSAKYVPFVGTTAEVGYNLDMLSAVNRLKKGQQISDIEKDLLIDYLRELKEIQVRGTTLPSKTLNAILESIPFFIEFGAGVAAAPETFGGSLSVSAFSLSKAAGKKAARKAVEKALSKAATESVMTGSKKAVSLSAAKSLYKSTYNEMLKAGSSKAVKEVGTKEAVKIVAKTTPKSIIAANFGSKPLTYMTVKNTIGGVADRQLSGSMQVTDAGEAVFLEPENMALSIMKSFGTSIFDNYTETMGWAFAPVASYFSKPIRKILPKKFFTEFEKLVTSRYGMPAAQALKKYGYDGVIEEMGEELLNRFLCQTFGINGLNEYTFDGFMNNVFYANDPEQWLVEALSFAAMGGAAHGTAGTISKIKEELEKQGNTKAAKRLAELANKRIYSPAEYYLEQGLIKIEGSQSAAEQALREKFKESGIDATTADEFFKTATELEIRDKLKEYFDAEEQDAGKRREKAVKHVADFMMKNRVIKKETAKRNAELTVAMFEKYSEQSGIAINDVIENIAPEVVTQEQYEQADTIQSINARLQEIEQEIEEVTKAEEFDAARFDELEREYNELEAQKNSQNNQMFQTIDTAGADIKEKAAARKEWKEKGTESSYFKKWFGDSKVVDWQGKPIMVYHGTENNFRIFKNLGNSRQIGANVGFFFTDNRKMAEQYGNNARVLPVYLSLQNPLIVEPNSTIEIFGEEIEITDAFDFFTQLDTRKSEQEIKSELIKQGYDGIILRNTNVDTSSIEDIHDVYIAFNPEQIKSANNRGTFDANNPNIYFQPADAAGAKSGEEEQARKEWQEKGTESSYFKKWSGNTPVVTTEDALKYNFKTGKGVTVEAFHGTKRADRVGSMFLPQRATSGPMAFFSSNKEIATNYSTGKEDTSLLDELNGYEDWFKIKINGREVKIDRAWWALSSEQRKIISERAPHICLDDEAQNVIYDENNNSGVGNYDYEIKRVRGDALKALLEGWLNGGTLFGEEGQFVDVLKLAGLKDDEIVFVDPHADHSAVYDVYLTMSKPLVTDNIPKRVITKLEKQSAKQPVPETGYGIDAWDKRTKDPIEWINNLKEDMAKGENSFAWTAIPDWVTDVLKSYGYDGIIDVGGKSGGEIHKVYIPFYSTQIKSVNNNGNFDADNPNIYYQSAYHGTPHRFDKFSLENIGTGEGNQAHGWGLYFAEDKEVSEKYRDMLANEKYEYKGKEYSVRDSKYFVLQQVYRYGKEEKIKEKASQIKHFEWILNLEDVEKRKKENKKLYEKYQQLKKEGKNFNDEEFNKVHNRLRIIEDVLSREGYNFSSIKTSLEEAKKDLKEYKNIDEKEIKLTKGQLFKVDVPENDVMLDEDKPLREQPEKVKKAIFNYMKDNADIYNMSAIKDYNELPESHNGEWFYNEVSFNERLKGASGNSDKEASLLLNKYGIKGITYNGQQDGRCYVVFDDKAVKVLETYYQEEQQSIFEGNNVARDAVNKLNNVKGYVLPSEKIIVVLKNADESTIPHELAHIWLDFLEKNSGHSDILKEDLDAVRKFLKNNGEPFTREQHEKFARSFEVYLRSGYAKNNKLKKIFEDFKNFLLAIYDDIKKIMYPENGELKTFSDEEIKKIEGLFDRLLTTEKSRIKTTVFDKIAEIDNKIEAIKSNEPNEFKELDEIWKNNIAALNRKSDKKRKVEEYLELADKMTSRETKEMKEFKKRYKDATLDILSVATGYDKRFIANPRNIEKVQMALEKTEDKITVSGGMRAEWQEFYTDTGVNYDTDEVGGDYKLAEQAFEVFADGRYEKTLSENYEFEEIGKFSAKVDYLHAKVKTLRGEEKQTALEALFSLFNNMPDMPDEVVIGLVQKLEDITQEYEDDQKNAFNSKVITSVPVMQQLQFYITQKLNDLKVYNPETRYKMRLNKSHRLYRYIKNINSVDAAKKQIRRINDFVIDDMRNNQRSLLHKEIQKQIKVNSKVIKVGSMSKGKFDWKTNTVFQELVEMNKMDRVTAEKQLGSYINIEDAAQGEARDSFDENETAEFNKTNDFQDILKKEFLQYRSMRLQDLDVTHTIQLLQDILELKDKGRQAKSEEDFINKTQRWNTKNNLLDILEITKNSGAKFGANWIAGVGKVASLNGSTLANWESLLNAIFNKDTAHKYSLLQDEAKSEIYARKHMLYFYERAAQIYGFKNGTKWDKFLDYDYMQPLIKLFQEYDAEKYTYVQQVYSVNSPDGIAKSSIEISRAQMITMFAWSLNEKLEQRLFTQFGLNQIREMFEEKLSKEDKELAWALVDTCEQMREDINEVFIRTTGLSLPKVENYFPSKAERVQSDIDMYHDCFVKSSSPSFIKERKICNRIPMKPLSPLEILIPHINKTAKYVVLSEKVNFLNQIFKDTAIKTKMQEIWGSRNGADIYQTLINKLAACTFTNYSKGTNLVAGALDTLSRNYITSSIGFSAKVTIGQLLSVVNYAENMPSGVWAKGFVETLKHPVENFNYMLENCEYLQTRLAGNSQNEIISILTSEKDKFRTIRNFMTSNVKWGDIIAITLGGKAYVDYLMQQGMSKEAAFEKFVEDTLRAQQAGTTSSISEWQSAQAKNCLTRMFFAFRNTDMQYERKFIDTLIQAKKGEIGKKELIKKIFIYKILNPFMFTSFLQNMSLIALFRGIFAGDDPDETFGGFLKSMVEAVMLSGLNAYGFAGFIASSVVESIIACFDKEFKHFEKSVPVMSDFDFQIQKYLKGDLSFADYVDAIAISSEFALGIPSTKIVNSIEGVGDFAQGNYGVGASRMAGWGRYTSTKAWTGKEPDKKKKKKK